MFKFFFAFQIAFSPKTYDFIEGGSVSKLEGRVDAFLITVKISKLIL